MLSVQKPPTITLLSPAFHHRRHPSAPVVVPTKIPGVLSIAKPSRPFPQPRVQAQQQLQQRIRTTPKPKSAVPRAPNPPQAVIAEKDEQTAAKAPQAATPEKNRGRQNGKLQKSTTRSTSHSSTRGGRRPHRQSSPPIQDPIAPSSQAEAPSMPTHQLSDPFIDDTSNVHQFNPLQASTAPTLSPRPSGKLARRRQQQQKQVNKNQNTPTHAIPVPTQSKRSSHNQISRSEPKTTHLHSAAKTQAQNQASNWESFPICDDMTDAGDASDAEHASPVTPTRPRSKAYMHANSAPPRSAPLHGFFPNSVSPPSPSPAEPFVALSQRKQQGGRKHRRTPSDGVFTMSSDEEANSSSSTSSNSSGLTPNVEALFRMVRNQRRGSFSATPTNYHGSSSSSASSSLVSTPTTVPRTREGREKQLERDAAAALAASYFASSSFQNSPSPDELPPPLFA